MTARKPVTADLFDFDTRVTALRTRAISTRSKVEMRRAKSQDTLLEVLPETPSMGTAYHVISHGDVDALSYLQYLVNIWPLDHVRLCTWCMALADVEQLLEWLDTGRIGKLEILVGEIFPTTYIDETALLQRRAAAGDITFKIARCHAKLTIGHSTTHNIAFAVESSANVNTNPRIEQTCITMDADLHDFYADFFDGIRSIHGPRHAS